MSVVELSPLDFILKTGDEKKALLLGIAAYLKKLNAFASVKKTPNLTEYNVGGVISIVEQLETLAKTYKTADGEVNSYLQEEDYFKFLVESWFCYEDCKVNNTAAKLKNYFNQEYDQSGTLASTIGKFILSLEPAINKIKYEMFKVSHKLLTRYSDYIVNGASQESEGTQTPDISTEITSNEVEDIQGLLRSFKTIFKLQKITKLKAAQRSIELRKTGNEFYKSNSSHAAVAKYSEALAYDPQNVALLSNRAAIYQLAKHPDNAIEDLKRAIEIDPSYEAAWTRLGFAYLTIGESLKSIEAYCKAIKLASDNKRVDTYIKRLVHALENAENRAKSSGISAADYSQYTDPIQVIIRNNPGSRPATRGPQSFISPQVTGQSASRPRSGDTYTNNINSNGQNGPPQFRGMPGNRNNGQQNHDGSRTPSNLVNTLNTLGNTILNSEAIGDFISNMQMENNNNASGNRTTSNNDTTNGQAPPAQDGFQNSNDSADRGNREQNGPQNRTQNATHTHGVPQHIQEAIMGALPQGLQGSLGSMLSSVINGGTIVDQSTVVLTLDQDGNPVFSSETANGNTGNGSTGGNNTNRNNNVDDDSDDDLDPADFDLD
ncbi:hypothetical protein BN7_4928 [Wickerhamomyces ciferrii]|uniref:Uncharacterized protein n=1 Tax=Wickerhamomyces ciferrii (strain ATCC 14091 / BCRC 22168 / CBS 111 / JCM 3599 / NBRC 0793 / NRRL Y-1031 F-60-10) TaxID=1206466 RepID=K0KQL6_WICCF|nr:uncharacterized protein BN7_4928 [Wickerhamomyces ciferrii]CCH45346.1 hypothetical protein BN7_4928 [Wickerhamomyces ciferrii]